MELAGCYNDCERGDDPCFAACTDQATMCYTLNGRNDCGMLTPETAALFGQDFCDFSCVRNDCPHACSHATATWTGGSEACPASAAASSKKATKEQLATSKLRVSEEEVVKKSFWCDASCAQSGLSLASTCERSNCRDCKGCAK